MNLGNIKLYKSATDKFISGVCGGLGESFGVDPTLIRLIWALITVFSGIVPSVILYGIAAVIMPDEDPVY